MLKSIRIMLAIATYHDYEIWQMDVKTVFVNENLEEVVYMTQPEKFISSGRANQVCKLNRSIYRLKQALRSWNIHFDETVKSFGFIKNINKICVYKKTSGSTIIFLILYVDDILLIKNDILMLQLVQTWLSQKYFYERFGRGILYTRYKDLQRQIEKDARLVLVQVH